MKFIDGIVVGEVCALACLCFIHGVGLGCLGGRVWDFVLKE